MVKSGAGCYPARMTDCMLATGGLKYGPLALCDGKIISDTAQPRDERAVEQALDAFRARLAADGCAVTRIACDNHPDYATTRWALAQKLPVVRVPHHFAHALAALWPDAGGEALAVTFDGTGLGEDGTVWGGEWLRLHDDGYARIGALQLLPLAGGEAAIRDPYRLLAGYCAALKLELPADVPVAEELRANLPALLQAGINAPLTSSAGRLFDAVAALCGCASQSWSEGAAPRALQALAESTDGETALSAGEWQAGKPARLNLLLLFRQLLRVRELRTEPASIARGFHRWLARATADGLARAGATATTRIVVAGGVWHNALLRRMLQEECATRGWTLTVPPPERLDDRGLAYGQLATAAVSGSG